MRSSLKRVDFGQRQPKECYGPEKSGDVRIAEIKQEERNVGAVSLDDSEVEGPTQD